MDYHEDSCSDTRGDMLVTWYWEFYNAVLRGMFLEPWKNKPTVRQIMLVRPCNYKM